ncbi:MAG: hypothetical protein WEC73_03220, partial [Chthoniobacterales bacterium]
MPCRYGQDARATFPLRGSSRIFVASPSPATAVFGHDRRQGRRRYKEILSAVYFITANNVSAMVLGVSATAIPA